MDALSMDYFEERYGEVLSTLMETGKVLQIKYQ